MGLRIVIENLKKEVIKTLIGCLLVLLVWHLKWEWVEGGLGVCWFKVCSIYYSIY